MLAALLRLGIICWKPESLAEDRDLYWGIAKHLAAGEGFVHPDLGHPTAYRPPLYPLLLAVIVLVGGGSKMLAVVQIGLSVATAWLTWRLARKFGGKSEAAAGGGVRRVQSAVDSIDGAGDDGNSVRVPADGTVVELGRIDDEISMVGWSTGRSDRVVSSDRVGVCCSGERGERGRVG